MRLASFYPASPVVVDYNYLSTDLISHRRAAFEPLQRYILVQSSPRVTPIKPEDLTKLPRQYGGTIIALKSKRKALLFAVQEEIIRTTGEVRQ